MDRADDPPDCRRERILASAHGVFLRRGYARATMGEIAQAAGLSRPTLYLAFPRKEDVFDAVVRRMTETVLMTVRERLGCCSTLEQRLRFACEQWSLTGYRLTLDHPDARDLVDLSLVPVRKACGRFETLLAEVLAPPLAGSGLRVAGTDLARMLACALHGFVEMARDEADLKRMIGCQVAMLARAIRGAE